MTPKQWSVFVFSLRRVNPCALKLGGEGCVGGYWVE